MLYLPQLRGKNGKALINLHKAENDDIDAQKIWSIKNSKSLLECPTITTLVASFDSKLFNDMELLKWYLAGRNRIINFAHKPTKNVTVKYLTKHVAYAFVSFTPVFSYMCSEKPNTLHMCVVAWRC